jgi:hypothetical protein
VAGRLAGCGAGCAGIPARFLSLSQLLAWVPPAWWVEDVGEMAGLLDSLGHSLEGLDA